jgi:peroxiredoxin
MALYQRLNDETYVLYQSRDLQMMKLLSDTLTALYPASRQVKAMSDDFQRELNSMNMRKIEEIAAATEPMEIDPDLMNTEGKRVSLSSLRGKYVLVTFWSTDSRDCITNNLQMKVYYSMYRKKGFEIYQINIDADEQKWKDAVKFDELPWISVREDDAASLRYTYIYNVQALPSNYLYDPDGEIVGVNLFGKTLEIKLEQLFGR